MVEVANGSVIDLLPVDGEGVWLPGDDFSQKQKESYPCMSGIDHRPIQPVGHPWGDVRVVDGAAIAAALLPVWQQLKLYRIQTAARTSAADCSAGARAGAARGPQAVAEQDGALACGSGLQYELYTRAGTRIIWGLASGNAASGEPTAEDKVARLVQYAAVHGGLDAGPSLDVRRIPPPGAAKP